VVLVSVEAFAAGFFGAADVLFLGGIVNQAGSSGERIKNGETGGGMYGNRERVERLTRERKKRCQAQDVNNAAFSRPPEFAHFDLY
jgi:hypothetical protein